MKKIQRITLVDLQIPGTEEKYARLGREPIGLLELGAYAREKTGCEVNYCIIDSESYPPEKLLDSNPDAIGFGAYSCNYPIAVELARSVKKLNPHIATIFGGPHVGMIPQQVLQENAEVIDATVRKEAEEGLVQFINGRRGLIETLPIQMEHVPRADRLEYLLDNSNFQFQGDESCRAAIIITSRGCNRTCDFCVDRLTGYRAKPIEHVIDEIKYLVNDLKVNTLIIEDPLFNGNLKHLENLCDRIIQARDSGEINSFRMTSLVDFNMGANPEKIIEKLAKAGMYKLHWGIEDPRQIIRKDCLNKKVVLNPKTLEIAESYRIINRGLLMIPTNLEAKSPEEDVKSYTDALMQLKLHYVKPNVTTPFPGTPLFERLKTAGKITSNNWRLYDTNHLVIDAGNWTQEIIDWARLYILKTFYASRGEHGRRILEKLF